MLQGEHSAILSSFIKLPFVIKIFVLSIFEWPLKTGFTVYSIALQTRFFILKICFFTSAAYIQVNFRLQFFMEANNMNPDQTAPKGAV